MKAYELLEQEGLVTAEQGKGFYVNAQDSEMLIEQHLRKVEASLTEAIAAARIAGLSDDELKNMLDALLMVQDSQSDRQGTKQTENKADREHSRQRTGKRKT